MDNKVTCYEIRSSSGELLFSIQRYEKETDTSEHSGPAKGNGQEKKNGQDRDHPSDSKMTEPQKRYMFRLLAEQGVEGDNAYAYLKKVFKIDSLSKVTKQEASQVIERLKGGNGDGSSVE